MSELRCPTCNEPLAFVASVPEEQRLRMTIESNMPYFAAEELGDFMKTTGKALKACAKEMGGKVSVTVSGAEICEGKAVIDFLVISVRSEEIP